jgi:hypothetical protein
MQPVQSLAYHRCRHLGPIKPALPLPSSRRRAAHGTFFYDVRPSCSFVMPPVMAERRGRKRHWAAPAFPVSRTSQDELEEVISKKSNETIIKQPRNISCAAFGPASCDLFFVTDPDFVLNPHFYTFIRRERPAFNQRPNDWRCS